MKSKIKLSKLLNRPSSLSEKFHQKTKIKKLIKDFVSIKSLSEAWEKVYFKGYGRLDEIMLSKPKLFDISLKNTFMGRKSKRKFSKLPLSKDKLSTLLYYSAGLRENQSTWIANRFYPSAGARYPLEVYLIAVNTEFPRGLYHYYLKHHSLERLYYFKTFDYKKYFNQSWIAGAGCLIVITAIFKRTTIKYGDRGYRHILIETGHLGQNFYLLASALDLDCCAIGGYSDDKLEELLDVDGTIESVVYVLAISNHD